MIQIGKKTKLAALAIMAIASIAAIAIPSYSYLFPKYPYHGTAREQTRVITRTLARDSVAAEVKMCERMHSKIKNPETTKLLLDNVKLETLYIMAEGAKDGSSHPWHDFFFSSILKWSDGFRPLTARLIREIETGDEETLRMVAAILPAVIHNMNWQYWSGLSQGSIAEGLIEKDRTQWGILLNTIIAKAQSAPGTVDAVDDLLVYIGERNDEHNIEVPTHLSVNPQLLDGPVGDALVELLGKWNDPARADASMRLMSAMIRVGGRKSGITDWDYKTDGSWAAENNERIGQALERELRASLEKGPPEHVGRMLVELIRSRNRPVSEAEAERLEQILLEGKIPMTPRTLRAATMGGKRALGDGLLALLGPPENAGEFRFNEPFAPYEEFSKLDLLAAVSGWETELAEAAMNDRTQSQEAVHHLSGLVRRVANKEEQKDLRNTVIQHLGQRAFGEIIDDKYLEQEAMNSLMRALRYVSPTEYTELRDRIEELALPKVKNGRVSIPRTPWKMQEEILQNMNQVNPETSLYEICVEYYEKLPADYKWATAYSAVKAVEAPQATEFFIRLFTDDDLEKSSIPYYSHDFLLSNLRLPMTAELVEAIVKSNKVGEQDKRSFLNRARKD